MGIEFLGLLEFFGRDVRQPDEQAKEMMTRIGSQVGQFIERREAEKRLMRQEVDRRIASEIQQGFLPKNMPSLSGFQISGRSLAPHSVGGDCFDFIPMLGSCRDSIGVVVADASGHGIGAALLMAETRAYLRGLAMTCSDVGLLLGLANQCLTQDAPSHHFVTAFLMRLDADTHTLSYASAGHLPGYVLDTQGHTRAVLANSGLPLVISSTDKFPTSPVLLEPGDLILLTTDGIVEAASRDDELFGMERTLRVIQQYQQQTPDEILMALFDAVCDFCNNKCRDDLTAVIIKVDGAA